MSTMSTSVSTENRKRKRENEVKKWTEEEIKKVLNYMQVHRNIEKPTAQLYYKKLLEETKINATWNILKCKVRHLKGTLQKADIWSNSTGAGVEESDGATTVKDKVLKICPHYEQLSNIFSSTKEIEVVIMDTTSDVFENSPLNAPDIEDDSFQLSDEPATSSADAPFAHKVKRRAQNTCFEKMAAMEAQRTNFRKKQLKLETEKFEWAKDVDWEKLEIEKQKIENDFVIKKLELEQNERLKMFEIEMKYKTNK